MINHISTNDILKGPLPRNMTCNHKKKNQIPILKILISSIMLLAEAHIYFHSPQIFKTHKWAAPWCCWNGVCPASRVETELISLRQSDVTNCLEQNNARSKEFFFFSFETGIEVQEQRMDKNNNEVTCHS